MPGLDPYDADAVCRAFDEGAAANWSASCRDGSIDLIHAPGRLIATGDLHDSRAHFDTLVAAAGLGEGDDPANRAHLTLHEIIHADPEPGKVDFSFAALARVAALKAAHPEFVHTLLANHELAQIFGSDISKRGVAVVREFDHVLDKTFAGEAPRVRWALEGFVRSMPLALRCVCPHGDILCAHSLPGPAMMGRFDPSVLRRELTEDDYAPRTGSAFMMVWGRGHDDELLEDLTEVWGVNLFILGHEHAAAGHFVIEPNALVLSSDHAAGVYLPLDLSQQPRLHECAAMLQPIEPD